MKVCVLVQKQNDTLRPYRILKTSHPKAEVTAETFLVRLPRRMKYLSTWHELVRIHPQFRDRRRFEAYNVKGERIAASRGW